MQKHHKQIIILFVFAFSGLCGFVFSLYVHGRAPSPINPAEVQMIQTFHSPVSFVKQLAGDAHPGEKVFKEFCASCHSKEPIIDVNAPHIGDKKAWQAISQQGMPALMKITTRGAGAMPSRGGCFECSDEQLQQTIQYILDQSK